MAEPAPRLFLFVCSERIAEVELRRRGWRKISDVFRWANNAGQEVRLVRSDRQMRGVPHGTAIVWGPRFDDLPDCRRMTDEATGRGLVVHPLSDLGPELEDGQW